MRNPGESRLSPSGAPSPIRLLHVVNSLEPGGLENGVLNTVCGLDSDRFEIHCACLSTAGAFADRWPVRNRVHVLDRPDRFSWECVLRLRCLIAKLRPHVIHTHNLSPLLYARLATTFAHKPAIVHSEHGMLTEAEMTPKRMVLRRFLYRNTRIFFVVSHELKRHMQTVGFSDIDIAVLINGVDTNRFHPADKPSVRSGLGIPENAKLIGVVSRLTADKRIDMLIEAFDHAAREHKDLQLVIVGDGPELSRLRKQGASSRLASRITLTGFVNEPLPYYQAMELMVLPSLFEGMSNVVLEAMSCATPVVSAESCGSNEIIQNNANGFIHSMASAKSLGTFLAGLIHQNEDLAICGESARSTIKSRFGLDGMIDRYDKTYLRALGLEGGAHG